MNQDFYAEQRRQREAEQRAHEEREAARRRRKTRFVVGAVLIAVLLVFSLIAIAACTESIQPGYAGVVYNMKGGIEGKTLTQGWHLVSPTKKITSYPVSTETVTLSASQGEGKKDKDANESFNIPTKTGKTINVDMDFSYHYDAAKLPEIFTKFRGQNAEFIEQSFIKPKAKAYASEVSAMFDPLEVYGAKRSELNQKAFENVRDRFAEFGIVIETLSFTRIEPDAETMKAIQARTNAQQALETAQLEKQKAEIAAQTKLVEAEGAANAKIAEAEGTAKANEKLQQSITPELLQMKAIEKWNGQPVMVNGGGGSNIIQVPMPAVK